MIETGLRIQRVWMARRVVLMTVFLLTLLAATAVDIRPVQACTATKDRLAGMWQGVLEHSGMELLIAFTFELTPDQTLTARMDVPEQDAYNIPVDSVILDGCILHLKIAPIDGAFVGEFVADSSQISGEWSQGGVSIPLVLEPTDTKPLMRRPQEPVEPFPYIVEEVTIRNRNAGITLAGTLTLPSSDGAAPAVLLLSGSGPQDRDESVFGHKPFLVLADYLTRRGIAVLRVDDRGVGGSTGDFSRATALDFAADATACIDYLRNRKDIDRESIGVLGHSEGAIIASMIASQVPDIAFVVLVASPGLPIREMEHSGEERELISKGASEELVRKIRIMNENLFDVIAVETDSAAVMTAFESIISDAYRSLSEDERVMLGVAEKNLNAYIQDRAMRLHSPWFRFYLPYDPETDMKKITCPVLALNGEKDTQVPPVPNLEAVEKALEAGENDDYTVMELPGLNHLLQSAEDGSISEYSRIEETMSPTALREICDWILKRTADR